MRRTKRRILPSPSLRRICMKTIDGAYSAFGFGFASVNYLVLTGDDEPLKQADPCGDVKSFHDYVTFMRSNEGGFTVPGMRFRLRL